ncbi:MAG: glycosyltransferase family 9 protein [Planctomycetes bacterium]|nr:glycosyltransferase family 9 protein [Planctomycetota bacterium]
MPTISFERLATRAGTLWPLALFVATYPLVALVRLLRRPVRRQPRFLVIQVAKIGDVVCTSGLFREVKRAFPGAFLTVEVLPWIRPLLATNPHIDRLEALVPREATNPIRRVARWVRIAAQDHDYLLLPTPNAGHVLDGWFGLVRRIVSVVETEGRCTTQTRSFEFLRRILFHETPYEEGTLTRAAYARMLEAAGVRGADPRPEHHPPAGARERAASWLRSRGAGPGRELLVGISPGAGNRLKEWEPARFAEVARRLAAEKAARVVAVGSREDRPACEEISRAAGERGIDACGAFDLAGLAGLLSLFDLLVSVDTGPLYLASALGVPVVDISGPIDVREQPPLEAACEAVYVELDCRPCSHVLATARTCRTGHHRCVLDTTPEMVLAACGRLLAPAARRRPAREAL